MGFEFERVTPESVGISSRDVMKVLDILEMAGTTSEPHALMLARHDKVFAEGWWSPYTAEIPHELFSMTKSYTVTAFGIAYTEGLVNLDDKLVDIFPEYRNLSEDARTARIRVRDLLMMASGKKEVRCTSTDWTKNTFGLESVHEPGEFFSYSCEDTHSIMAVVQKVTGKRLDEYLNEKLFPRIGVNPADVIWAYLPDGSPIGCGGLVLPAEATLRLVRLYMNYGMWEGDRILSEDFVRQATGVRIPLNEERYFRNQYTDPDVIQGYGFQIWANLIGIENSFGFYGAIGQRGVGIRDKDIMIAYHQGSGPHHGDLAAYNLAMGYLNAAARDEALPEDPEAYRMLQNRLSRLALKNPVVKPYNPKCKNVEGIRYAITEPGCTFRKALWNHIANSDVIDFERGMEWIEFRFPEKGVCEIGFREDDVERTLIAGMDGVRRANIYEMDRIPEVNKVLLDGAWVSENRLRISARWIQTCFGITLEFAFDPSGVTISPVFFIGEMEKHPMQKRTIRGVC